MAAVPRPVRSFPISDGDRSAASLRSISLPLTFTVGMPVTPAFDAASVTDSVQPV